MTAAQLQRIGYAVLIAKYIGVALGAAIILAHCAQ